MKLAAELTASRSNAHHQTLVHPRYGFAIFDAFPAADGLRVVNKFWPYGTLAIGTAVNRENFHLRFGRTSGNKHSGLTTKSRHRFNRWRLFYCRNFYAVAASLKMVTGP